jgi:NAD(P)-dependent dehydrogenase (short-subunit alcohol dehydrogenase family)
VRWIAADLSDPQAAAAALEREAPAIVDALIYNVGIWEPEAFGQDYDFLGQSDQTCLELVGVNVSATILILKRLLPRLLAADKPRLILTGSTSGLPGNGRPEVAFGASKAALNGIASALREGYRDQRLGVTLLQLGYLNTDDRLSVAVDEAAQRGNGEQVPVHDVVALVRAVLSLSPASFVRELVLPAIGDIRF